MALRTLGTSLTTSLQALSVQVDDNNAANVAALMNLIKTPLQVTNGVLVGTQRNLVNGAYTQTGTLIVPGRGVLIAQYGDFVAVDPTTGWPILISADCAANGAITHT